MKIILNIEDSGDSIGLAFACRVAERVRADIDRLTEHGTVYTPTDDETRIAALVRRTRTGFSVKVERQ